MVKHNTLWNCKGGLVNDIKICTNNFTSYTALKGCFKVEAASYFRMAFGRDDFRTTCI